MNGIELDLINTCDSVTNGRLENNESSKVGGTNTATHVRRESGVV